MKHSHERKTVRRVAEPVQVYLDQTERGRLDWLAELLGETKSDVVRRGLEALERQVADPAAHPALKIIGIAEGRARSAAPYDIAREHDRFLAESEVASWNVKGKGKRGR
jgi:hypothetical protein